MNMPIPLTEFIMDNHFAMKQIQYSWKTVKISLLLFELFLKSDIVIAHSSHFILSEFHQLVRFLLKNEFVKNAYCLNGMSSIWNICFYTFREHAIYCT
jgi:hypothetical protein